MRSREEILNNWDWSNKNDILAAMEEYSNEQKKPLIEVLKLIKLYFETYSPILAAKKIKEIYSDTLINELNK